MGETQKMLKHELENNLTLLRVKQVQWQQDALARVEAENVLKELKAREEAGHLLKLEAERADAANGPPKLEVERKLAEVKARLETWIKDKEEVEKNVAELKTKEEAAANALLALRCTCGAFYYENYDYCLSCWKHRFKEESA